MQEDAPSAVGTQKAWSKEPVQTIPCHVERIYKPDRWITREGPRKDRGAVSDKMEIRIYARHTERHRATLRPSQPAKTMNRTSESVQSTI